MANKLSNEEFIKRAQKIHKNPDGTPKYDYSITKYNGAEQLIEYICPIHGKQIQNRAFNHLKGSGCKKCNDESKKLDSKTFFKRIKQKHPNFDYSKTKFKSLQDNIIVGCQKHGYFSILAHSFLYSYYGCQKCGFEARANINQYTNEQFINLAKQKHIWTINDKQDINLYPLNTPKYLYNKTEYKSSKDYVIITCPIHGDFEQLPQSHLRGCGCPKCAKYTTNLEFISKSKEIHKNPDGTPKYLYDKTEYKHSEDYVIITCPIHGDFKQLACSHLQGHGCPKCANVKSYSNSELEIQEFLKQNNIEFKNSDRTILYPQELDIFIPLKNIAIEYNGLYWHSEFYKSKNYHLQKLLIVKNKVFI